MLAVVLYQKEKIMKKLSIIVLVALSMVIGCALDRNIQITNDYDGIWQLKMYVGHKYYQDKMTVVNGQFNEKYSNGNVMKGYISVMEDLARIIH